MELSEIKHLHVSGRHKEARDQGLELLKSESSAPDLRYQLLIFLAECNFYEIFDDLARAGRDIIPRFANDYALNAVLAFVNWVTKDFEAAEQYGKHALACRSDNAHVYNTLGMLYLTQSRNLEAFLMFSACMHNVPDSIRKMQARSMLAKRLMSGVDKCRFAVDGEQYTFALSCFNGQSMEAAMTHSQGTLTELEELHMVRDQVGHADTIVEIGTLVGNHTSYFSRVLTPKKIICIDANKASVEMTGTNFALNNRYGTELVTHYCGIGQESGRIRIGEDEVEVRPLTQLVDEPVDFIKADVDGMEMQLLEGARPLIEKYHPTIMIEVKHVNREPFLGFCHDMGYTVKNQLVRGVDTNFIVTHAA